MFYDSAYRNWVSQWSTTTSATSSTISYSNAWYDAQWKPTPKPKEPKISNEELMKLFEPEV